MNSYKPLALQYLNQWYETDINFSVAIQSLNVDEAARGLNNLASAYSLNRNLAMKDITGKDARRNVRLARLRSIALDLPNIPAVPMTDLERFVWGFGETIGKTFLRQRNKEGLTTNQLSAASKFLWFAGLYRVRIFDSQAYAALYDKKTLSRYRNFCAKWEDAFKDAQPTISQACDALATEQILEWTTAYTEVGTKELIAEIRSLRFCERVFDRHLWIKGAQILDTGPN
jgi:hypothetical protein